MLDYPALAALDAVVREGSFERAALALGVTPSAVSQRVKGLEERLGAVLVVRGQPCTATDAGRRLCAHLDQVRLLEAEAAAGLPALAGAGAPVTLRVAVNADSLAAWFMPAAATFAERTGALLDLVLDDEGHTAGWLRSGQVLAAVTADPEPVQGCRLKPLGALRYVATAAPRFMARHFPDGVTQEALARAPVLRFDRRDGLQARWAKAAFGATLDAPTHWIASTHGFLDASLAGLGWALNPRVMAAPHLASGALVALAPRIPLDVPLFWQHARIGGTLLAELTRAVSEASAAGLEP